MSMPSIGRLPLRNPERHHNRTDITVEVVRTVDQLHQVFVMRALTYMAEQDCPYREEFDGNDMCGLHLIAYQDGEPVGCLRLRFFAGFCKVERVAVSPQRRGSGILNHLMMHAFEVASQKGYRRMLAHMQTRLEDMWAHVMECRVIDRTKPFAFSGVEYLTLEIPLPEHPNAISFDSDPFILLRPEGAWDRPGVLDPSSQAA